MATGCFISTGRSLEQAIDRVKLADSLGYDQPLGAQVTGSDRADSPYAERLREHGIEPMIGHARANVPTGAEVIYSLQELPGLLGLE